MRAIEAIDGLLLTWTKEIHLEWEVRSRERDVVNYALPIVGSLASPSFAFPSQLGKFTVFVDVQQALAVFEMPRQRQCLGWA